MATFSEWLEARDFDPSALTDRQRSSLLSDWKRDVAAGGGGDGPNSAGSRSLADALAAKAVQEQHEQRIDMRLEAALHANRLTTDDVRQIRAEAFADPDTWDDNRLELEAIRRERPKAPGIARHDVVGDDVIEAAVCRAGGLGSLEKDFKPQTLEAASRRFKHGLGLEELLLTYARRNGHHSVRVKSDVKGALMAAFAPEIKAAGSWGPSTGGGLSGVLSNVANKFLREGFQFVETVWRDISSRRNVTDFKQVSTYSLTGGMTYEKVPPGGEIKHATLGAETYTNQVDTRGRMIGLDRRDLINDDLGALTGVSRRLGRGAASSLNRDFWTVFLNNSSFFTSGRNNVSTGAGSALSLAGLDAANQKFVMQTDPDGEPMGVMPKILLVPPALEATAMQLMSDILISGNTTATGNRNPWGGRFIVRSSAYMQNTALTGNSSAAWYLLADPNDVPVIEVAFLNGIESPTVETAEADFAMLGIAMRAFLDYGIAFQEYRGGVRSAGS